MLRTLFSSKVRIKVLSRFLKSPSRGFYLRELERLLKESASPLRRELLRFEQIGFLRSKLRGNQKHYFVNPEFPLFKELKVIFEKAELSP